MAVEDDDDVAVFFDADMPDVCTATFTPSGGAAVDGVTIIVKRPEEVSGVGLAGISEFNTHVLVRVSEIGSANPGEGVFSNADLLDGASHTVAAADLDETQKIWTCALRPNS